MSLNLNMDVKTRGLKDGWINKMIARGDNAPDNHSTIVHILSEIKSQLIAKKYLIRQIQL